MCFGVFSLSVVLSQIKLSKVNGLVWFGLLVFYITCNDISAIYVTAQMCRRTDEEVVPTVGLPTP